ncbi:uncharacterized protein [Branchiostoma lanceolatum]|uniref:uncharacterized protein n=1 Tax=Branchiostoma lanceolatum TaxID=7740 RepID=UPI0034513DBF
MSKFIKPHMQQQARLIWSNLEGDAKQEIKLLSARDKGDPRVILDTLKGAFQDTLSANIITGRFYTNAMGRARRRDPEICANPDKALRDQFIEGIRDRESKLELLRRVRVQPDITFCGIKDEALALAEESSRVRSMLLLVSERGSHNA